MDILEELLKNGADPNAETSTKVTSIFEDAKMSRLQTYPSGIRPLDIASEEAKPLLLAC